MKKILPWILLYCLIVAFLLSWAIGPAWPAETDKFKNMDELIEYLKKFNPEAEPKLIKIYDWLAYVETQPSYAYQNTIRTYHWKGDFGTVANPEAEKVFDKILSISGIVSAIPAGPYAMVVGIGCLYTWEQVNEDIVVELLAAKKMFEIMDPKKPLSDENEDEIDL